MAGVTSDPDISYISVVETRNRSRPPSMGESTLSLEGLSPIKNKALVARFDDGDLSSDSSLLVLRQVERRLGRVTT